MEEQKFQERRKVKDNNQQTENSLACARVVCMPIGHTHTGINNITGVISDQARAHVREGDAARPESAPYRGGCAALARRLFHDEMVAAWRERIFADGVEDPVKVAVEEAVKDFGGAEDFTIWAWYANRIGVNSFLELYFEQKSVMRTCALRSPAAAFHMRLKRFYAALAGKESAR